jgi:manganese transport protein
MYRKILVALENGPADAALLPHVAELARQLRSALVLLHVADGFAARYFEDLSLAESEEVKQDRDYLEAKAVELRASGLQVTVLLAMGEPPEQVLKAAQAEQCDLIAMASHGHRFLGDLIHGSTISEVRHKSPIPLLIVRGKGG